MSNKEFEDFFKELDQNEKVAPKKNEEEDDLVFSSFFEDATTSSKKSSVKEEFAFEDETFAPPPPEPSSIPPWVICDMVSERFMVSIIPVETITGRKNIARNAARPSIFWFITTAMNREKITTAGTSNISF